MSERLSAERDALRNEIALALTGYREAPTAEATGDLAWQVWCEGLDDADRVLGILAAHLADVEARAASSEAFGQRVVADMADVEARLVAVEALADEWDLDQNPHAAWLPIDFAHALRAALHPDPTEPTDPDRMARRYRQTLRNMHPSPRVLAAIEAIEEIEAELRPDPSEPA